MKTTRWRFITIHFSPFPADTATQPRSTPDSVKPSEGHPDRAVGSSSRHAKPLPRYKHPEGAGWSDKSCVDPTQAPFRDFRCETSWKSGSFKLRHDFAKFVVKQFRVRFRSRQTHKVHNDDKFNLLLPVQKITKTD